MYNPCESINYIQEFVSGVKLQTIYRCINYGVEGVQTSLFRILGSFVVLTITFFLTHVIAASMFKEKKCRKKK